MSAGLSGDEVEEVEQGLLEPAADRDGLDGAAWGGAIAPRTDAPVHSHQGPLDAAERLPEPDVGGVDRAAAGALVGAEQVVAVAEAADRRAAAAPPGLDPDPAQVEHRIADVGELPVEHAAHAAVADDQVAVAEVAVDDRGPRSGRQVLG